MSDSVVFGYYFDSLNGIKDKALTLIKSAMQFAVNKGAKKLVLCYTGHGASDTGDWIYTDGTLDFHQIMCPYIAIGPVSEDRQIRATGLEIFRFD